MESSMRQNFRGCYPSVESLSLARGVGVGRIPGPLLANWTSLWLAYHTYRGCHSIAVHKAHKRYGPVVRISPNHISFSSAEALSIVYAQGRNAPAKSPFYDAFHSDGAPSIFSTRDRHVHARKRKMVSHAFSNSALQQFVPLIHPTLDKFIIRMDKMCKTGEYFDALDWFQYFTFDVLSDLAFGEPIGMLEHGSHAVTCQLSDSSVTSENIMSLINEREKYATLTGVHPPVRWARKLFPFLQANQSASVLEQVARTQVLMYLACSTRRQDILGKIVEAQGYDTRSPTADEIAELTAETVTLLVAGAESTANSAAVILHLLATHPVICGKLLGYLHDATGGKNEISYEQAKDVPYLHATINEGLRIFSPLSIGLPRVAPADGVGCGGHHFPEGTVMSVAALALCQNAEVWGDPQNFRPERWLEGKDMNPYFVAFGKGPRACVSATMILRYKIDAKSDKLDMTENFLRAPTHVWLRLSHR
ncbi:benzoate para-hydroxylase [Mycena crocata]|nr:benzoate para-hydroxylase [Mycena crocata]